MKSKVKYLRLHWFLISALAATFSSGASWANEKQAVESGTCPNLVGYYFYVTPTIGLSGTTISQSQSNGSVQFVFVDQGADGKPSPQQEVYSADGSSHAFSDGQYVASCSDGSLVIELSYVIPEGDHSAATFTGTKTYSTYFLGGIQYLKVQISGAVNLVGAPNSTPINANYSARKI